MEFLEKTEDIISDMNISEVSLPLGKMEVGSKFSISGFITSNLPIKHIWGGVYESFLMIHNLNRGHSVY